MNPSTQASLPVAIGLKSPLQEIDAELRRTGVFQYSHEYVKDIHFERYVLPVGLKSVEDVQQFLRDLDTESQQMRNPPSSGCQKAWSARHSLEYKHNELIEPFDWALSAVARARRTHCGCHEVGSFCVTK
jgi:hypothetical protein